MRHCKPFKPDKSWSLFLDRDGVINKRLDNECLKSIKDFQFIDGVKESIEWFSGEFYSSDQPYYKILRELGLGNKVILHTQFIPNDKVAQYFCASDLVVQPYKDASQSGVTQVAYHFDVPMIVSNVGALPEMVPNNIAGLVVKPEPDKVARAIHRFFDKNMAEELKKGLLTQKDRFSWSRLTQAVFDVAGYSEKQ